MWVVSVNIFGIFFQRGLEIIFQHFRLRTWEVEVFGHTFNLKDIFNITLSSKNILFLQQFNSSEKRAKEPLCQYLAVIFNFLSEILSLIRNNGFIIRIHPANVPHLLAPKLLKLILLWNGFSPSISSSRSSIWIRPSLVLFKKHVRWKIKLVRNLILTHHYVLLLYQWALN